MKGICIREKMGKCKVDGKRSWEGDRDHLMMKFLEHSRASQNLTSKQHDCVFFEIDNGNGKIEGIETFHGLSTESLEGVIGAAGYREHTGD